MPPPSAPVADLAQAVAWLEAEAHRIIRASAVPMDDGTLAFPPQVGIGYKAFWLRDYVYALEGSIGSFSDAELAAACRIFLRAVRADGAAVDCVKYDGQPIYKPGYGTMGREPVADGPTFTVSLVWHTHRRLRDRALLDEALPILLRTMEWLPRNPSNGLVHIANPGDRCPYGFTDSIPKSGDQLFDSLLAVQAARQLAGLLTEGGQDAPAARWRQESERIAGSILTRLWQDQPGLFVATSGNCNVPDIWGSAFAVWLGVADGQQARRIAAYFRSHHGELVEHGQVRHLPGFLGWDGKRAEKNGGTYQSGAFWATPVGWFVNALDLADPALADRTVVDMVRHFQQFGACEWIDGERRKLPGYTASAALPLAGIRTMLARRAQRGP